MSHEPRATGHLLSSLAYTLQTGREPMEERLALLARSLDDLVDKLTAFTNGEEVIKDLRQGRAARRSEPLSPRAPAQDPPPEVDAWIADGNHAELMDFWIRGGALDWRRLHGDPAPARINLPTYPFAKERCRIPTSEISPPSPAPPPTDASTPAPPEEPASETPNGGLPGKGTFLLAPAWDAVPAPRGRPSPSPTESMVIVGGTEEIRIALQKRRPNTHALEELAGDSVEEIAGKLNGLGPIDHILWAAPFHPPRSLSDDALIDDQKQGVLVVFRLIKALLGLGYGAKKLDWSVVVMQTLPVHESMAVNPAHASLHGLIGSMAKEYSNWKVRLVDLEAGRDWPLDDLFNLPADPRGNPFVHRGGEWFQRRLIPFRPAPADRKPYRTEGVYVVIGGAGGVGKAWSEYIIRRHRARIVWIGRREQDAAIRAGIDSLRALGPAPRYISADAADPGQLRRALEIIKKRHPRIHGLVQSAIVLSDQSLENMTEKQLFASLSAKVDASVRMAGAFEKERLDFVLFFSSMQSFLTAPGQSNYAAGCTFSDAFAHRLSREWPCAVKVIHWGWWGSVGVVSSEKYRRRMERIGVGPIEPPEAMDTLETLLSGPADQLALMKTTKPLSFEEIDLGESMAIHPGEFVSCIRDVHRRIGGRDSRIEPLKSGAGRQMEIMEDILRGLLEGRLRAMGLLEEKGSEVLGSGVQGSGVQGSGVQGSEGRGSEVLGSEVLGSEVQGSGVQGLEVQGSEVQGSEVQGSEVQGSGGQGSEVGSSILNSQFSIFNSKGVLGSEVLGSGVGSPILNSQFSILNSKGVGSSILNSQFSILNSKGVGSSIYNFYGPWLRESVAALGRGGRVDLEVVQAEWERRKQAWREDSAMGARAALVEATLGALPEILGGETPATDILFPDSSMALVEGIYKNNPAADYFNERMAAAAEAWLEARLERDPHATIRILEIGAGTGGATASLLSGLRSRRENVAEYCYTDLSRAFLMHGKKTYGPDHPCLVCKSFDVEKPLAGQGIRPGAYDLVVAANVLHATKNIRSTLRNAKALLKKNGLLLLNEISDNRLFTHLTFGLLEGWWLYEDPATRIPGCPGLSPETWRFVLETEGFRSVLFPASEAHDLGQQIIVAESDGAVRQPRSAPATETSAGKPVDTPADTRPGRRARRPARQMAPARDADEADRDAAARLRTILRESISEALDVPGERIRDDHGFSDYGVDSIVAVGLIQSINRRCGLAMSTTVLFDHPNVERLLLHILSAHPAAPALSSPGAAADPASETPRPPVRSASGKTARRGLPAGPGPESESGRGGGLPVRPGFRREPIAIIGMSGRFPGSETADDLWTHLADGDDLIQPVARWDLSRWRHDSHRGARCGHGGFLEDLDRFDPMFFNISGREAAYMDPQQRLFLEESWKALEDAGCAGEDLDGRKCGVYAGCLGGGYGDLIRGEPPAQAFWGIAPAVVPARIAYHLDLRGPAAAVDTACSSSLVAIHLACQGLWTRETEMALAGGVFAPSTPAVHLHAERAGMLSPTGRCRAFDDRADGFVIGEAAGVVVLKRLDDALADGDRIHGVIVGSGINQDGATNGITAPSAVSQERLEREVYDAFAIDPRRIGMVETHGTGTILGDPIEHAALKRTFEHYTDRKRFCAIGSIKTNIGHALTAAGIASVIKVLLSLRRKRIPPSLHYRTGNPDIDFDNGPFYVNTRLAPWEAAPGEARLAAVSSFGFSGTNAHLVIREAPGRSRRPPERPGWPMMLSARAPERLREQVARLAAFCERETGGDPGDMSHTLLLGRRAFVHRWACTARDREELARLARQWLETGVAPTVRTGRVDREAQPVRPSLKRYGNQCIRECREGVEAGEYLAHLDVIADLWVQGCALDYPGLFPGNRCSVITLPTYPFARERHWIPGVREESAATRDRTLVFEPIWDEAATPAQAQAGPDGPSRRVVMLAGSSSISPRAVEASAEGVACVRLRSRERTLARRHEAVAADAMERIRSLMKESAGERVLVQIVVPSRGEGRLFSGLAGLLRTAHRENPAFRGQLIEADDAEENLPGKLARDGRDHRVDRIRRRNGKRWVRRWRALEESPEAPAPPWRDRGVYLITGGVGGLGLIFAEEIARAVEAPVLILAGRSPLAPEKRDRLDALTSLGARAVHRRVDVSRREEVDALIRDVEREFGALHGILHCAGVIRDNYILKKTAEEFTAVLAPKVAGTVNLDRATRDLDLDLFVLFSAAAGIGGNAGQADYAAANAFMDAYADHRNRQVAAKQRRGRTLAVAWPLWKEGGMRVDGAVEAMLKEREGMTPLETPDGISALTVGLARGLGRILVLSGDPSKLGKNLPGGAPRAATAPAESASPGPSPPGDAAPRGDAAGLRRRIPRRLKALLAEIIRIPAERIDAREPLETFGIDSIMITQFNGKLESLLGPVPQTLLLEHATLAELADRLIADHPGACAAWAGGGDSPAPDPEEASSAGIQPAEVNPAGDRPAEIKPAEAHHAEARDEAAPLAPGVIRAGRHFAGETGVRTAEPIAIIGIAGRHPRSETIETFWKNIAAGVDCITDIPLERWPLDGFYEPDVEAAADRGRSYARKGAFLETFAHFDPLFFNISPGEALDMDPQERLILTVCWEAMENGGYSRRLLAERSGGSVGVFIGVTKTGFALNDPPTGADGRWPLPATSFSSMANRVSHQLDLSGPSLAVDAMCASSLTAIHEACEYIRGGGRRLALAGAVNLYLHPRTYLDLCRRKIVTDEARIHCFSKTGKGFIPGEGAGAALLKPLERALRDGDPILGIVRGTGINHGGRTGGYGVPGPVRQRELIQRVLARAGCDADAVDYIESAANGSALGDAAEYEALRRVFRTRTGPPALLGTIKPTIGHPEAASGLSQLTKVLCQMKHGTLAPTRLSPRRLDPAMDWENGPLRLVTEAQPWPSADGSPRRALITSFGAGGSQAAMVVEEHAPRAPAPARGASKGEPLLFLLSARTRGQLKRCARRLRRRLPDVAAPLSAVAYTLQRGRDPMRHRLAVVAGERTALVDALAAFEHGRTGETVQTGDANRFKSMGEHSPAGEMAASAAQALAAADLPSLARLWVDGFDDIPWRDLYDERPARCRLPSYPFDRRIFWRAGGAEASLSPPPDRTGARGDGPSAATREATENAVEDALEVVTENAAAGAPRTGPVRPPEEIQADLEGVIKEILLLPDEEELDPEATFLDLGLDSIRVVRFIRTLSESLALPLRETLVFDYPTIGALAEYIARRPPRTAPPRTPRTTGGGEGARFKERLGRLVKTHEEAVPLHVEGDGPVLFCIHPMSGDVGVYSKMAEAARARFRVIGIRSRGFLTDKSPLTTIEAMGRYYAEIITAADPRGPCHLLGASMGGVVAHETARRLQLRGKTVATLLLVEAPLIENEADAALWDSDETHNLVMNANFLMIAMLHMDPDFRQKKRDGRVQWSDIEITPGEVGDVDRERLPGRLAALIERRGARQPRAVLIQRLESMAPIHLANLRALNRHRPEPLPRPGEPRIVLMRSRGADATSENVYNPDYLINVQRAKGSMAPFFEGWKRRLPRLETRVVDGENHFDMLHTRAAVRDMADFIAGAMACGPRVAPGRARPASATAGFIPRDPGDAKKIAVIGMSGRFPGARTTGELWRLLKEGRSAVTAFPGDRGWDLDAIFQDEPDGAPHVARGGFLEEIDRFDPLFFHIPPNEAALMDPSERIFLQECWKAVEDAGMDPAALSGKPWGVFCGGGGDYTLALKERTGVSPHVTVSGIPGRVSYSLNLTGPCLAVDAGCASSLMAIAQACDHLVAGRCEVAIAGGALVHTTPNLIVAQSRTGVLSRKGGGRALDEGADGMAPGEAAGVLVLKPLADALAGGDRIHGVIEGWGFNHNGRTNGMAAPSAAAEAALFSEVHGRFGIDPETIRMVEANAAGTPLGDAVEVRALTEAFRTASDQRGYCALGTVENNIGHAFQASGVCHVMKVLLAFQHREIPPTIHVETPNPSFALPDTPFFINDRGAPWPAEEGRIRRAAVNSFGAAGVNVHLVMAEAPAPATPPAESPESDGPALIVLSAKTPSALKRRCRELEAYLARREEGTAPNLSRISANLLLRRGHFPERCALVVDDSNQLRIRLAALAEGDRPGEGFVGTASRGSGPSPDAMGQKAIRAMAEGKTPGREDLLALADVYTRGGDFDLSGLFSEAERHPLSLPAYPFEKRRCWTPPSDPGRPSREEPRSISEETGASPGEAAGEPASLLAVVQAEVMTITGYMAGETDVEAPFTRLGLDSLMSMRLLGTLNERFSLDIQLADLLEHDAIRSLALLMENRGARMGVREETRAGEPKPTLAPEAFSGPTRWFSDRLARLPDVLHVVSLAGESAAPPDASLESFTRSLEALTREGVAVFHAGARCYFLAHRSIDIRSVLDSISPERRRALLGSLPPGILIAPASREQERVLHHSEVMGQWAWNIQHIYETTAAPLEIPLLNEAMAHVVEHHDVLRTRFLELPTTWAQIVAPEADAAFQHVEAEGLPGFQSRIAAERNKLLRVDGLPIFKAWISQNDDACHLGFVAHHALADAFTTTLLFTELMSRYHALSQRRPFAAPAAEPYWMYALRQFDERVYRNGDAIGYWRDLLADVDPSMPLPYARDPREVDGRRFSAADMHILSLSASLGEEIERFGRAHETNLTQLFTAAVAMTIIHGLGARRAVVQFINNQRDRASLIHAPGEFTNVLFIPFEMDPQWTVVEAVREVRKRILTSLRHARTPLTDLLEITGLGDLGNFYRQTGDIVLDSADIDAATLDASAKYGRSLFADSLFRQEASPESLQAVSTIFFQVLKMNRRIHLVTTHRKRLFDASEIRQWSALIVRFVEEMIRDPERRVKEILADARRPLDRLRRQANRHPRPPRTRTERGDPLVVQALEKFVRGEMDVEEAHRRIDPIQGREKPAQPDAGDAAGRTDPHVVEALEKLIAGETSINDAQFRIDPPPDGDKNGEPAHRGVAGGADPGVVEALEKLADGAMSPDEAHRLIEGAAT